MYRAKRGDKYKPKGLYVLQCYAIKTEMKSEVIMQARENRHLVDFMLMLARIASYI